jgi:hypothetical protein
MDAAENTIFYGFQNLMGYGASKVHPWRYFKCDMDVLIGEDRDLKVTHKPSFIFLDSIMLGAKAC